MHPFRRALALRGVTRSNDAPASPSARAELLDGLAVRWLGESRALIIDGVLGTDAATAVRAEALDRLGAGRLRAAGVGGGAALRTDIRGDEIAWLSLEAELASRTPLGPVLALFDRLREDLNALAYIGATGLEVQLAVYQRGRSYARHADVVRGRGGRRITAIYYANQWWGDDGGELELWEPDGVRLIEPLADRLVLFRSDTVEHAVRPVRGTPRVAISGWMR